MLPKSVAPVSELPCACGCGQTVRTSSRNGNIIRFRPGHHRVKGKLVGKHKIVCAECGSEVLKFGSARRYCSRKCYWKARGLAEDPPTQKHWKTKDRASRTEFIAVRSVRLQRLYMLEIQKACGECGWDKYPQLLELHHKNQRKDDGRKENLDLLCPTCHEVHHYLEGSGRFDSTRYSRVKALREKLGLDYLPRGVARTSLQRMVDQGKIVN